MTAITAVCHKCGTPAPVGAICPQCGSTWQVVSLPAMTPDELAAFGTELVESVRTRFRGPTRKGGVMEQWEVF